MNGFLVITRSPKESIFVGDSLIEVNGIRSNRVRIGISAPRSIEVLRSEIVDAGKATRIRTPLQSMAKAAELIRSGDTDEALRILDAFAMPEGATK